MPDYASLASPRKMESYSKETVRHRGFNAGNILGDPFALATVLIGAIAWIITIAGSVAGTTKTHWLPSFIWWTISYEFCCIAGIAVIVTADAIHTYQVAAVGFLAAGMVFTTSGVSVILNNNNPQQVTKAHDAAAAGLILLTIVNIIWIFYYGSLPTASHRYALDALALQKEGRYSRASRQIIPANRRSEGVMGQPPLYTSAQLRGLETSSPVTGFHGGLAGEKNRYSEMQYGGANQGMMNNNIPRSPEAMNGEAPGHHDNASSDYPYKARAIYSYEANPSDPNEISFSKHETLEISDVSGRWWQARKSDGTNGIAPSNYLILL